MAEKKEKTKTKTPTAEKRMIQNEKRRKINQVVKSKVRTAVRRFEAAVTAKDKEKAQAELSNVFSNLDRAVKAGIYKVNKSSRTKSRLTAKVAAI